jgi:hypothetical protein
MSRCPSSNKYQCFRALIAEPNRLESRVSALEGIALEHRLTPDEIAHITEITGVLFDEELADDFMGDLPLTLAGAAVPLGLRQPLF